jgi:hypothetical protein
MATGVQWWRKTSTQRHQKQTRASKKQGPYQAPVLTPVIPATQEAEIRRMAVQSQFERPYLENTHHRKDPSPHLGVAQGEGPEFKLQYHKNKTKQKNRAFSYP